MGATWGGFHGEPVYQVVIPAKFRENIENYIFKVKFKESYCHVSSSNCGEIFLFTNADQSQAVKCGDIEKLVHVVDSHENHFLINLI